MDVVARARRKMVSRIDHEFRATAGVTGRSTPSSRVWWAISAVSRQPFLEHEERPEEWFEGWMPFGQGQAVSRAFYTALILDLLDLSPDDVALEVGTGSGYQAALLGALAREVFSVEVQPRVADLARERLAREGYRNVEVSVGAAPPAPALFDAIVVSDAAPTIPRALLDVLREGGRLVVPVAAGSGQQLLYVKKALDGRISWQSVLPVRLPVGR